MLSFVQNLKDFLKGFSLCRIFVHVHTCTRHKHKGPRAYLKASTETSAARSTIDSMEFDTQRHGAVEDALEIQLEFTSGSTSHACRTALISRLQPRPSNRREVAGFRVLRCPIWCHRCASAGPDRRCAWWRTHHSIHWRGCR